MHLRVVGSAADAEGMQDAKEGKEGEKKAVRPMQMEQSFSKRNSAKELSALYEKGGIKTKFNLLCNYPETNHISKVWQYLLTFLIFLSVLVHCTSVMNKPVYWEGNLDDEQYDTWNLFSL